MHEATTQAADRAPADRSGMLRITEIFHSLQGEALQAGLPTVFIRLTGCPLRCNYCDSEYAFYGGEWLHLDDILERTAAFGARYVCVTGGEPLAQKRVHGLLTALCDAGYEVSLETSGALDVGDVDARVSRVMDLKTPDSGEEARNRWDNVDRLRSTDQLKFVICSRGDYEWAREQILERDLADRCPVLLSPAWGQVDPAALAGWILEDRLPVRFQLQLHKLLWGEEPGR